MRSSIREDVNHWLAYHDRVTRGLVAQRTSLESRLIPVSAYILIAAAECYRRHPEMVAAIADVMAPEDIGRAGGRPGTMIDAVHLWSVANIFLHGRQILIALGRIAPDDAPERVLAVLEFWSRAAGAWRGDGHLQAADAGLVVRPHGPETIERLMASALPIVPASDDAARIKRLNALLTTYLFLLWFDTRAGIADAGPYELTDGRTLLVRTYSKLGVTDFPWSADVARGVPCSTLVAALVLDGVRVHVNDWGTSVTDPSDYLDRIVGFGLYTADGGGLEPVDPRSWDGVHGAIREAQSLAYRLIAGMSRRERINAGAYVYFTFLRPFAEVAGIADALDWHIPQASLDVYEMLEGFEGTNSPPDPDVPYYTLVP